MKGVRMWDKPLTLHEAIVLCMVRKKRFTMSTEELAKLNASWSLWRRPGDKEFPEAWQVFLRSNRKAYHWLFDVVGDKHAATVTMRTGGASKAARRSR